MRMILLVLALALAGCESIQTKESTSEQKVAVGCASASAAIRVLTEANKAGKLTTQQQNAVSNAISIVMPICTAPTAPTLGDSGLALFTQSVLTLQGEAVGHE